MKKMYNIILITIDCLRADHLSCFGYKKTLTPNIDKLAEGGVLFHNAFSNGPYTAMSFPSIFTSTYPLMYPHILENDLFLSDERTSFVQILKKHGYKTAAFHSNPHLSAYFGYGKGFDVFKDHVLKDGIQPSNLTSKVKEKIKSKYSKNRRIYSILKKLYSSRYWFKLYFQRTRPYIGAHDINREALEWISKTRKNFFVWLHYMDLHVPYLPPQPFLSHIRSVWLQKKTIYKNKSKGSLQEVSTKDLKHLVNLYDRALSYVDYELGVFLECLKDFGIDVDNTFIIVTSDHGEEFMEHGDLGHLNKLYDELLHVPLIIANPSLPREKIDNQVGHIDLAPTIMDLVGLKKEPFFLGSSLVPYMKFPEKTEEKNIISEYWYKNEIGYSLRTKGWKLIITFNKIGIKKELYDLNNDPREQINMAEYEEMITKKLVRYIKKHIAMEKKCFEASSKKKRLLRKIRNLKMKMKS